MNIAITKMILAAVTSGGQDIGGVPVFHVKDAQEGEVIATTLSRVLEAVAHDLGEGIYILVKH